MRRARDPQLPLSLPASRHRRAQELVALDTLLDNLPQLSARVALDLVERAEGSAENGRPGMTGEQVLRAALLLAWEQCTYEQLAYRLEDSRSYSWFFRLEWGKQAPSASTLQENIRRVRPETWAELNQVLTQHAIALRLETGNQVRIDCTVTETSIHPPEDSAQLYDGVRVLTRLLRKAQVLQDTIQVASRTKRAKRRRLQILNAKDEDERKRGYRDLLRVTKEVLSWVPVALTELDPLALLSPAAQKLRQRLHAMASLVEKVVHQTQRRVMEGKKVKATDKVVSLFEPHTDVIVKDRRSVQYGHKLLLGTVKSGLVVLGEVLSGNPTDSTLVGQALDGVKTTIGKMPKKAAFDGCFASKAGLKEAKEKGVQEVCFSKRRGIPREEMTSSPWIYRQLWRFRAGVEAGISYLKRCFGLDRCTWSGEDGFSAYVGLSIFAHNALRVVRLSSA